MRRSTFCATGLFAQLKLQAARQGRVDSGFVNGAAHQIEGLERRLLLAGTPIANTSAMNTGADQIQAAVFAVSAKIANLKTTVDGIHDKLAGPLGGLPLVGDSLKNAVDSGTDTFNQVAGAIESKLIAISGLATITGVELKSAIYGALGPGGLKVLPASIASAADVPLRLFSTDGIDTDAEEVLFDLSFGGTLFTAALNPNFDLGLPGLGLTVNGTIKAEASYEINLKIGANKDDGFFVDLTAVEEAKLTLNITAPGLSATGRLGFLQLTATDGTKLTPAFPVANTSLTGSIGLNFTGGTGNLLKFGDTLNLGATFAADAKAEVHLHTVLSFGGSAQFPSLVADFDMEWGFGGVSAGTGGVNGGSFGSAPSAVSHLRFRVVHRGFTLKTNCDTALVSHSTTSGWI